MLLFYEGDQILVSRKTPCVVPESLASFDQNKQRFCHALKLAESFVFGSLSWLKNFFVVPKLYFEGQAGELRWDGFQPLVLLVASNAFDKAFLFYEMFLEGMSCFILLSS